MQGALTLLISINCCIRANSLYIARTFRPTRNYIACEHVFHFSSFCSGMQHRRIFNGHHTLNQRRACTHNLQACLIYRSRSLPALILNCLSLVGREKLDHSVPHADWKLDIYLPRLVNVDAHLVPMELAVRLAGILDAQAMHKEQLGHELPRILI